MGETPLDFRRAAAKDLAHQVSLHKRVDDLQAAIALRREDVEKLSQDLPCTALREAADYLLSAWFALGEARHHLVGE